MDCTCTHQSNTGRALRSTVARLPDEAAAETIEQERELANMREPVFKPGIFHAFRPSAIEYIVTGEETTEELEAMEKRGFTLVEVCRDTDT